MTGEIWDVPGTVVQAIFGESQDLQLLLVKKDAPQ